jgi:Flp pilus assembly protein TadD
LRISAEDPVAHNYLGLTYENLGRQQEAIAAYKQAIAYKADYAEAHYNLGVLYISLGDRSQAEAEYNALKNPNSDLADALLKKLNQLN